MSIEPTVRPANADDHPNYARLFAELGVRDEPISRERWEKEHAPTTFFVDRDGATVAYAYYEVFGLDGYVRNVVVDASARRTGLGKLVMRELARRLGAAGCERWQLNVKVDNEPAIALYRSFGMSIDYATHVVRVPWSRVEHLPRASSEFEALALTADDERAAELAFDVPQGRIAKTRMNPKVVVFQVIDRSKREHAKLGLACFDPGFPGCFPFHVARPELARCLLEALQPFAPSDKDWIQLVVEDDARLATTLLEAGAELVLEIAHMQGAIPS